MPRFAPILQDVAARLAGRDGHELRRDPVAWAHALRDATDLAAPDVVVSHHDPQLEADALRAALADGEEWADRLLDAAPLALTAPATQAVELVRTLAGLGIGGAPVAAAVSAPASVAAALAATVVGTPEPRLGDREELADLACDALCDLVAAYALAGAGWLLVVESAAGEAFLGADGAARARGPLLQAAEDARIHGIALRPPAADGVADADAHVHVPAEVWAGAPTTFGDRFAPFVAAAGADGLLLSDGPIPADAPHENLRAGRALVTAA